MAVEAVLSSRIDEVTVFTSGARVRRVADLPDAIARAGANGAAKRVRLVRLPLALDDGSVRAKVEGGGALAATDLRVVLDVPPLDPSLAPPRDEEIHDAQMETARLRAEIERVNAMIGRVANVGIAPRPEGKRGEPPPPTPFEARRALAAFKEEEHARLSKELGDLERALVAADRKLASLKDRALRATTARNAKEHELHKTCVVTLDGAAAEPGARLVVEYQVPGARWAPGYALYLGQGAKSAELVVRAAVAQRTGEDWKDARLVLSTADPEKWTELPDLKSVRIGRAQPRRRARGWREPPVGAYELYADYDRAFGPPRRPDTGSTRAGPLPGDDEDTAVTRARLPSFAADSADLLEESVSDDARTIALERRVPAPARAAGPMPAMPVMEAAASLSAPAPAPQGAAAPMKARGMGMLGAMAPAGRMKKADAAPPPPPPEPVAPAQLDLEALAYGRLRMAPPNAPDRGALVAMSDVMLYYEAIGGAMTIDLYARIRVAVQLATSLEGAPPAGHELVQRTGDFDYAYKAAAPVDVPSDGAFHVVQLGAYNAEAKMRHVTVPRESQDVFRVLEIASPLDAALLRGPIDVYRGGAYMMTGRVPPTPPRGRVRLGLGVEQGIKVARNTSFAEKATGILGGGLSLHHEIEVDLVNATGTPAEIEVRERVPIAREDDKEIEVVVEASDPAWNKWSQENTIRGGYRWTVSLDPSEKRKLSARYVVKIASKQELVGGNRREA